MSLVIDVRLLGKPSEDVKAMATPPGFKSGDLLDLGVRIERFFRPNILPCVKIKIINQRINTKDMDS